MMQGVSEAMFGLLVACCNWTQNDDYKIQKLDDVKILLTHWCKNEMVAILVTVF